MTQEWVKIQEDGRILIPAEIRKEIKVKPGEKLLLSTDDGELKILSKMSALEQARSFFAHYIKDGSGLIDELIDERRKEAAKEMEEINNA